MAERAAKLPNYSPAQQAALERAFAAEPKDFQTAYKIGECYRVRVGSGRPPGRQDPADFVLKPWGSTERKELPMLVSDAADAVELLVHEGLERAQNRYNT